MKKAFILVLIPVFIIGAFVISQVNASSDVDYDIDLGNGLSGTNFNGNTYVEEMDKETKTYEKEIPETFVKIAEDSIAELWLEYETLAIAVRTKANGYVYSSYHFEDDVDGLSDAVKTPIKSGVTLDLFINGTPVSVSYLDTLNTSTEDDVPVATSEVYPTSKGFTAKVDFNHPSIQIKFDLLVTLENGELTVNIPYESIEEYNENLWDNDEKVTYYLLRNIVLFPYFGSTEDEDDGYVLIPDGSGALISLEEDPAQQTTMSLEVYGEDLGYMSPAFRDRSITLKDVERITMPLYGVFHDAGNTGFYTIVESGEPYAQYNFKSTGLVNDFYSSYFKFRYRQSYEQYQSRSNENQYRITFQDEPNAYDAALRYVFLSGTEADYVGMAKSYQEYLLGNGDLTESKRDDFTETPTKIDIIGTEITQGILALTNKEITTYEEVMEILEMLSDEGYNELITSLKTYNMSDMGYRFDIYRQLGGRSDFNAMMDYFVDSNIEFSYYLDYARSWKEYSRQHSQTLSKREIFSIELSSMFFAHSVNDSSYFVDYAQDDLSGLQKYGVENIALNGLDFTLNTNWDSGIVYATEGQTNVNALLDYYNTNNITTAVYNPDAYMYRYVDAYYDAPISSSDYSFISASVPFLQLVVGGYMDMYSEHLNFASDEATTLLRLVEYGVFPSYVLTGGSTYDLKLTNSSNVYISEYEILENRMTTYKEYYTEGLNATIQNEMVDHSYIAEGVVVVEYSDGTMIVLNYNDEAYTYNETVVEASGYEVIS